MTPYRIAVAAMTLAGTAFLAAVLAGGLAMAETRAAPPLPTTPQAFADQLSSLYPQADTTGDDPNWFRWHDGLYDPEFMGLMDENRSYGPLVEGYVDLDHDPLCGCQTTNGFFRISSITLRTDGAAEIKAAHCFPANDRGRVKSTEACTDADLIIKRIGRAWRLYDVLEPGSIRDRLIRHNACLRKAKTSKAADDCLGG